MSITMSEYHDIFGCNLPYFVRHDYEEVNYCVMKANTFNIFVTQIILPSAMALSALRSEAKFV